MLLGVAYPKKPDGMRVDIVRELSQEEVETYFAVCKVLNEYSTYGFAPRMVYGNHAAILAFLQMCISNLRDDAWNTEQVREYILEANRIVLNYLASVRFFTEFVETRVSRRYGRKSEQTKTFKLALSTSFDSSFAYRFLYKFRNYVQHCGHAVEYIEIETNHEEIEKSKVSIICYSKTLLAEYSEWAKVTAELKGLDDIDLIPLTMELAVEIRKLDAVARSLLFPDATPAGKAMINVLLGALGQKGDPVLVDQNARLKGLSATAVRHPPMDALRELGLLYFT